MPIPGAARVSRRTVLTVPVAAVAAGPLAACLADSWDTLPATRFTIATGNRGGVFNRYGEALATVLSSRLIGLRATTRPTDASVQNLELVADRTCDLGFSLGDIASDAVRGAGAFAGTSARPLDLVALARTYDSFVHLVVRADSGIETVADLRGRRVGLGASGSGTRVIARRILRESGVPLARVQVASEPLEVSADALREGRLAAFFFVSGIPNQAVLDLSREVDIRLVALGDVVAAMVTPGAPEYVAGPIPASTYGLPDGVDTVSVKNYVVAHRGMETDLAYAVTRVMFEEQDQIERLAPGVGQPGLGAAIFTSPLDLHPGAVEYYREQHP